MATKRQPVKVLRFWYRISTRPEVRALPHPAFRWLYGVTMGWTGYNNAAIEFTRARHGAAYGLSHREVFERARRDVLATGLVTRTRIGGRNLPDLYALVNVPFQVPVEPQGLGTSHAPTPSKILGTSHAPMTPKSWGVSRPKLGRLTPQGNRPALKNARASEYGKAKSTSPTAMSTALATDALAISDACQGEGVEPEAVAAIPAQAVH